MTKDLVGIFLLNLGGPDSLQAVRPFLYNLFSDREIIRLGPSFMQKPVAWLISMLRAKKTCLMYGMIGGKSPILDITSAQAKALEEKLQKHGPFRVYIGMRYWHPFIEETLRQMHEEGIKKIVALSLYPHYSKATTGSTINKFRDRAKKFPFQYSCITEWYDNPFYIDALVELIKKGLKEFEGEGGADVLFSAHSLPRNFIEEGDPYVRHINATIKEITKKLDIRWHLGFQSKTGPVRWLEPTTEEKLKELAGKGLKKILIVPISFVSDHIETLYEIDILYKEVAEGLGIRMKRADSLNLHPMFISALEDMVTNNLRALSWLR